MGPLFKALGLGAAAVTVSVFFLSKVLGLPGAISLGYLLGLLIFLGMIGGFGALGSWLGSTEEPHLTGWTKYVRFNTDHKVIGIQYLVISFVIFLTGGLMALIMRLELSRPGMQFLTNDQYNTVMGLHGISMVVVALLAIMGGLGNYAVPLMVGAKDMAFPRMNALSFWILPPAVIALLSTLATGGFDFGWTAYPPLSTKGPQGKLLFVLAFVSVGFSSMFGAINFLTTIIKERAQGLHFSRLPIFVWSVLSASIITLLATSVVASGLLMVLFDRVIGSSFFNPAQGGNALLYQHLFWYYSHPAVYIMILPAFGVLLEILPVFARKPLFAYPIAAASFIAIVILSFIVWAHHLFTSGMWSVLHIPFMITTEMISVPTGVVFLSALGTLWMGRLRLRAPALFAVGVIFNFLIGGLTGIFLADVPTDLHLHDSWFVVAHFHFTIMGGAIFAFFAGFYYWFPKITGRMLNEGLAKIHFALFLIGFNSIFIPMFWMGTHGMRRRVADYPEIFSGPQMFVSLAALVVALAVITFFINVFRSLKTGQLAGDNPWNSQTLDWQTSSPPPAHNFEHAPTVSQTPYEYGEMQSA